MLMWLRQLVGAGNPCWLRDGWKLLWLGSASLTANEGSDQELSRLTFISHDPEHIVQLSQRQHALHRPTSERV